MRHFGSPIEIGHADVNPFKSVSCLFPHIIGVAGWAATVTSVVGRVMMRVLYLMAERSEGNDR